ACRHLVVWTAEITTNWRHLALFTRLAVGAGRPGLPFSPRTPILAAHPADRGPRGSAHDRLAQAARTGLVLRHRIRLDLGLRGHLPDSFPAPGHPGPHHAGRLRAPDRRADDGGH